MQEKITNKVAHFTTVLVTGMLLLTSCNFFGGIDKPSGDAQLLVAARACLDKGDFVCAKEYYQALSSSYADVKISEVSLTTLAENNIFFMTDLITSLGDGKGGTGSIITLAETLAARGKTGSATRTIVQSAFANESSITDVTLKSYSQFISSTAMLSSLLANAVGADGKLTASDLASDATACKASGGCAADTDCDAPGSTDLLDKDASGEVTDLATATEWDGDPSITKVRFAANAANTAINNLTGAGGGIFSAFAAIDGLGGGGTAAAARCSRQILIQQLFP